MQKAPPPTPKGFRDILPKLAKERRKVIRQIEAELENAQFDPIETPTIEFTDTLMGKYGEEEKLIYKFTDRGGRNLALRYDLTVPLARFIASNPTPLQRGKQFRRYQVGQVFRGENPQHGRYREFTQFDFDSVGPEDKKREDALIIKTVISICRMLGLKDFQLKINSRETLKNIETYYNIPNTSAAVFREMDKVGKKDPKEINQAIVSAGNFETRPYVSAATITGTINPNQYSQPGTVDILYNTFQNYQPPPTIPNPTRSVMENELQEAQSIVSTVNGIVVEPPHYFKELKELLVQDGIKETEIEYERTLVRGIDYYTGIYFELKPSNRVDSLTIGSGGRYDKLIGTFSGRDIPAVGFSFGIDRLIESLEK